MAMALNLQSTNGTGTGKKLGWLVWWTLEGKDLPTADVVQAATAANVPAWLISRINGRGEQAAWMVATQTGVKGIERPRNQIDPLDAKVRYMTKDVNATCRAIVREVLDPANKVVGSVTVAQVFFTEDPAKRFQWLLMPSAIAHTVEVRDIVEAMAQDYQTRIGVTDYGRIRALIIDWLILANRVTVRGSGGVYLVPRPKNTVEADRVQGELVALATWVGSAPLTSLFSIVEVSDSGATTVQVFQKAAIDELKAELDDVDANLSKWLKNPNMNAGSLAYSAGTMLDRVEELSKRTEALIDALGEEIGVVSIAMNTVMKRAKTLQIAAQVEVDQYQATKKAAKAPGKAQEAPKAATPGKTPSKPVSAPSVPLKPVDVPVVPIGPVTVQDAPNWDAIVPVIPQAPTTVKAQGGKKTGVTSKAAKKL